MGAWVIQLGSALLLAGSVYGGIRADLASLTAGVAEAKAIAIRANERLDSHLDRGVTQ